MFSLSLGAHLEVTRIFVILGMVEGVVAVVWFLLSQFMVKGVVIRVLNYVAASLTVAGGVRIHSVL